MTSSSIYTAMQISLTPNADKLIEQMMTLGYPDPASVVEVALERMVQVALAESEAESPEVAEWMRQEVAIGADQLERGEFSTLSLNEIKAEVLAAHQQQNSQT
jgi:hypothetical protein